jgi:hypothetical protein
MEKHRTQRKLPRDVKMFFGAFDIHDLTQSGVFSMTPSDIQLHEDWNPTVTNYDADIAILIAGDEIPFTKYIKPICMWKDEKEIDVKDGIVAAWGANHGTNPLQGYEPIPTQLKVPIYSQEECFLSNPVLVDLSSKRTFCGGSKEGKGVCNGKFYFY